MIFAVKSFHKLHLKTNCTNIILLISHLEILKNNLKRFILLNELREKHEASLLFLLGNVHFKCTRNFLLAREYFSQIIQKYSKYVSNLMLVTILKDLGVLSTLLADIKDALAYCEQSLNLSITLPNSVSSMLIAENMQTLGAAYRKENNFEKARYYLLGTLEKIKDLNPKIKEELESETYAALGWLHVMKYLEKKESHQAEHYIVKSLEVINGSQIFHENLNMKLNNIPCYMAKQKWRAGVFYNLLGNYKKAMKQGYREAEYLMEHMSAKCGRDIFLEGRVAEGIGVVLLRENKLELAEKNFTKAIEIYEKLVGSFSAALPKIMRVEARIRNGKLVEAYEDYEAVSKTKRKETSNYIELLNIINTYHGAVIKYKQGYLEKASEHFSEFFKRIQMFCKLFLDESIYKKIEENGVFENIIYNESNAQKNIIKYLQRSVEVFSAIYGSSHPFVQDYILKNYKDSKKTFKKF